MAYPTPQTWKHIIVNIKLVGILQYHAFHNNQVRAVGLLCDNVQNCVLDALNLTRFLHCHSKLEWT